MQGKTDRAGTDLRSPMRRHRAALQLVWLVQHLREGSQNSLQGHSRHISIGWQRQARLPGRHGEAAACPDHACLCCACVMA